MNVKHLRKQLMAAIAMVVVAGVALSSATYAWFVRNNQATATTTQISAQSNAAYLLIEAGSKTTTNSTTSDIAAEEVSEAIATNVGYNGIMLRVYIWMEGTDADCVNNTAAEDEATYSVTVKLAGVAS